MARSAWDQLEAGQPWHRGADRFPLAAYSEFMPPPRLGRLPYGTTRTGLRAADDPGSRLVTEHEEAAELAPGLEQVAHQVMAAVARLGRGEQGHGFARSMLADNPY